MNRINHFTQRLLAGAVAVAIISLAAAANAENITQNITVTKVTGGARSSMDGGKTFTPLHKGDVLKQGSMIQTSDKGTVDIILGEPQAIIPTPLGASLSPINARNAAPKANVVRILPNSVLSIDKLSLERTGMDEVADTQLDLKAGYIIGNVKKLSAASRYEVKIPNGVAGIRGTTFMIGANGTVYVLTGSVVISYVDGQGQLHTVSITAGNSYNPFTGVTTPLTQQQLVLLESIYSGPISTPPTDYTKNGTVVHISPD
jgi:hypothetical protein